MRKWMRALLVLVVLDAVSLQAIDDGTPIPPPPPPPCPPCVVETLTSAGANQA